MLLIYIMLALNPFIVDGDPEQFEIKLQFSDGALELECVEGCAWNELSVIPFDQGDVVNVDFYGMADPETTSESFRFNISYEQNSVVLSCVKGCSWSSYELNAARARSVITCNSSECK